MGTWNVTSGAELWRTRAGVEHPGGLDDWEKVDPSSFSGLAVTSMLTFGAYLYAGIFTQGVPFLDPGCGVWRSRDGRDWEQVNLNGFLDPFNSDATTLVVFRDRLYAGTENGFFYDLLRVGTGTEIWRTGGEEAGSPARPGRRSHRTVSPDRAPPMSSIGTP